MKKKTVVALAVGYLMCTMPAHALQCYQIVPDEAFEAASRVVIVQLNSIHSAADSATRFELSFDVLASLKGPSSEKIELALKENRWVSPGHFVAGVRYLWFLDTDQAEIRICEKVLVLEGRTARWYASWQEKNAL